MTFPFRSVPSKRNASSAVCRSITCTPPLHFRSVPFGPGRSRSVVHHAHARRSSCKKNLVESEIAFASVIKTPLFEYLPSCLSMETAPCS